MNRLDTALLCAAAALLAGCASTPPEFDSSLEPFAPLAVESRSVLAEEIREPDSVVAALVDVDMRSDPRATLLRYTPVRFAVSRTGDLHMHALAPEETFPTVSGLRDAILRRRAKGTVGVVVFFNGVAAGTPARVLGDREAQALAGVLADRLQPMLEESGVPFAWIVPNSALLFRVSE